MIINKIKKFIIFPHIWKILSTKVYVSLNRCRIVYLIKIPGYFFISINFSQQVAPPPVSKHASHISLPHIGSPIARQKSTFSTEKYPVIIHEPSAVRTARRVSLCLVQHVLKLLIFIYQFWCHLKWRERDH